MEFRKAGIALSTIIIYKLKILISFRCLLRIDLKVLLKCAKKKSLLNLYFQPSGDCIKAFNSKSFLGPQAFTMTQRSESTAFSTMWISV